MSLIFRNFKAFSPKVVQQYARQMGRQDQFNWKPTKSILPNKRPKLVVELQEDFKKLGRKGDLVQVKPGYARHVLIPKGIVDYASDEQIKIFKREDVGADGIADHKLLTILQNLSLTLERPKDIEWEITKHHLAYEFRLNKPKHIHVPVSCMKLDRKICNFGDYEVEITVNKSVTVPVKITVKESEQINTEEVSGQINPEEG